MTTVWLRCRPGRAPARARAALGRGGELSPATGPGTGPGPVTVMAFVEGRPRRVQIALDEAAHKQAVEAYREGAQITCTGDLVKQGATWVLQNPKGFSISSGD